MKQSQEIYDAILNGEKKIRENGTCYTVDFSHPKGFGYNLPYLNPGVDLSELIPTMAFGCDGFISLTYHIKYIEKPSLVKFCSSGRMKYLKFVDYDSHDILKSHQKFMDMIENYSVDILKYFTMEINCFQNTTSITAQSSEPYTHISHYFEGDSLDTLKELHYDEELNKFVDGPPPPKEKSKK